MKKTIIAVFCLAMTAMGCMANDDTSHKAYKGHGNASRHEMVDPVINMNIVKQMGLSDKKVQQIAALQETRNEEIRILRSQHMPQTVAKYHHGKGQHHAAQGQPQMAWKQYHRGQHRVQMQAINEKYRKDMQDIMGTKTYVKYVEQLNDRLSMHRGQRHHKGHGRHKGHKLQMHKHHGSHHCHLVTHA